MSFFGKLFTRTESHEPPAPPEPARVSSALLDGKIAIVTGANTGIGKATAIDLAKRGAVVIMACRSSSRGEAALIDVKEQSQSDNVFLKILDLASLKSIRDFCESFLAEYEKLNILVNNAGISKCPYSKTEDGFENQLGVNHFGHFALTNLLLSALVDAGRSRIVNVSAAAHTGTDTMNFDDIHLEQSYTPILGYARSKLANILFTKELHRRLYANGVTSYAVHPGAAATELGRYSTAGKLGKAFLKSAASGAQTSIFCAVEEGIEQYSGLYFTDCAVTESSPASCDEEMAKKLWEVSEEMTGVQSPLTFDFEAFTL